MILPVYVPVFCDSECLLHQHEQSELDPAIRPQEREEEAPLIHDSQSVELGVALDGVDHCRKRVTEGSESEAHVQLDIPYHRGSHK